jgi:hypothetical protein
MGVWLSGRELAWFCEELSLISSIFPKEKERKVYVILYVDVKYYTNMK